MKALRHYDAIGVLSPAHTDARTRYRLYTTEQLIAANEIVALRSAGVPLSSIRTMSRQALEHTRYSIERRVEHDTAMLRHLDALLEIDAFSVAVKEQPSMRVVALRRTLRDYDELDALLGEVRASIPRGTPCGVEGAVWHSCVHDGLIDCEAFVQVHEEFSSAGGEIKELPSSQVACVAVHGGDEEIEGAYGALYRWLEKTGNALRGERLEWYYPASCDKTLTEVRLPIGAA